MRYLFFIFSGLVLLCELNAQPVVYDTLKAQNILIGLVNRAHIADSLWFSANYNEAVVSEELLNKIDQNDKGVTVEIYFGTWCSDSRVWVPAFMGMLDKTNMADKIQLIALPGSKKLEETARLEEIIEMVPTFVFWRNGKEIGRIVESPEETLAKDMIRILVE